MTKNTFMSSHLHLMITIKVMHTWHAVRVKGSELVISAQITCPVGKSKWN